MPVSVSTAVDDSQLSLSVEKQRVASTGKQCIVLTYIFRCAFF